MLELPRIMVAPNGARRTKADHPRLPVDPEEIAATAAACHRTGAGAIHAHVRDANGRHVLDASLYRRLLGLIAQAAPEMIVQISTEAVGLYDAEAQMALVRELKPRAISAAIRELVPDKANEATAADFYRWCAAEDIAVQHILYDGQDVLRLAALIGRRIVPAAGLSVIYVLGRYSAGQESSPQDLPPFLDAARHLPVAPDWMVCAFGRGETDTLAAALSAGGKVRVGFENSIWDKDGAVAASNEARVATIKRLVETLSSDASAAEGKR